MVDIESFHELALDGDLESVGRARLFFAAVAAQFDVDPERVKDGQLAVTELVTNAFRHGAPPVALRVVSLADVLRVEVLDADPTPPVLIDAKPSATSGRGLAIIAAVAAAWGHEPHPTGTGKAVWFTLPIRA